MTMKHLSFIIACLAIVVLGSCTVSEDKLSEKVTQGIIDYEQKQGNELVVSNLTLVKDDSKGYTGVLRGKLNGEEAVYDVTITDSGSDFDIDWELRDTPDSGKTTSASFFDDFTFENFLYLLRSDDESSASKCGLNYIYNEDYEGEDGDAGMSIIVYGWGIVRGEKADFGYELKPTSSHAVYYASMLDTSTHSELYFKDKADAERFYAMAQDYGLVFMGGDGYVNKEKLPDGKSVVVESFADYDILCDISKPESRDGYYVITFNFFA